MNILEAICSKDLEAVKKIIAMDQVCIDQVDANGIPLPFIAAKVGDIGIVKYIVEYSRASMNIVDEKNRNILHYATQSGNLELVKYLVEKVGMSPVSADIDLVTPFDIAHDIGDILISEYYTEVCGAPIEKMYRNPIRTGMFPDPSVVRVGEDYYMVNSSFIFFPCIPISHSKDLIHWKIIGHAITNPDWAYLEDLEGGRGYWAPDISYHQGKFYITATYRLNDTGTVYRRQMVVSSEKAEGPYSKPTFIEEDGIDPSLFTDEDGRRYMLLNRGARIFEVDQEAKEKISEPKLLYYGAQKRAPEGPHLLKKDGYYYLFLAEGGTGPGHRITVARSKTLMGNYEPCPYNPIMRQEDEMAAIQRCGHGKPVMTQKGEWFMVYLCGRRINGEYSVLGRETAIDPITWTADGWPMVNDRRGPSALQKNPDLEEVCFEESTVDDFDDKELDLNWMFPRPPKGQGYRLKDSCLWIQGSEHPLSTRDARNIVLRRQKDFSFRCRTKMLFVPMKEEQNAGLICYYDENSWLKFGVFQKNDKKRYLQVWEHIGLDDILSDHRIEIEENAVSIILEVETDYLRRTFRYSYDGESFRDFLTLDKVYYLSDEGIQMGKRFTGAMVGMYAYAGKNEWFVPFDYFHYEAVSASK